MIQYDLSKSVNIYEEIEMGIDKNLAIPFHFFSIIDFLILIRFSLTLL